MIKKTIKKLDLDFFYEKMDNGLEVFLVPLEFKKIYATFSTKYGGKHKSFLVDNKYVDVPAGMAHFLEHKMFEMESGEAPFEFFSKAGVDCNAYTSFDQTTYLFQGSRNFYDNLNYLLHYVQSPFLTDENVEKEKGIIEQEIKMCQDIPDYVLSEKSIEYSFREYPIRHGITGTVDSVNSITKESVMFCYNTFYHPSNMFLVVCGKFDPETVINMVKENQAQKNYSKKSEIVLAKYEESDEVMEEKIVIEKDVSIPKVGVNFKVNIKGLNISRFKIETYFNIFRMAKYGWYSDLTKTLHDRELIDHELFSSLVFDENYALLMVEYDTNNIDESVILIKEKTLVFDISAELFERKKKLILSSYLYSPEQVTQINNIIMNSIISYNKFDENFMEELEELNYEEFKEIFEKLNFSHTSTVIVKNK